MLALHITKKGLCSKLAPSHLLGDTLYPWDTLSDKEFFLHARSHRPCCTSVTMHVWFMVNTTTCSEKQGPVTKANHMGAADLYDWGEPPEKPLDASAWVGIPNWLSLDK